MASTSPTFAELFKKYRLRSEFETLGDFAQAMQDRGLQYEESIYSHWQRGTRIPRDRNLLLILLRIFIEHGGITSIKDSNALLESVDQGYLTDKEIHRLPKELLPQPPFLAPREIRFFTGREKLLNTATNLLYKGSSILIHGSAGMGKSSCAIRLAHMLADYFHDGVLWYRLDTSSAESILNSIAYTYGENISQIQDIYYKSSYVRSLLASKKVLLVFDNLEKGFPLDLLLPSSIENSVLITSRHEDLADIFSLTKVALPSFEPKETVLLQKSILGEKYVEDHREELSKLSLHLGNLPLAINLVAQELKKSRQNPKRLLHQLQSKKFVLEGFKYENQDIVSSLNIVFNSLPTVSKVVLLSLAVFDGTDFPIEAVAAINCMSKGKAELQLGELVNSSLVEYSLDGRYRLHPVIKLFVQNKLDDQVVYKKAAEFFAEVMKKKREKKDYFKYLRLETISIVHIFKKCVKLGYPSAVQALWSDLSYFLWDMGEWRRVEELAKITYGFASKHDYYELKALCCIEGLGWVYYWTGRTALAEKVIREALCIGIQKNNKFITAYAKQRLGRTLQGLGMLSESMSLLKESLVYFKKRKDYRLIGNNYRYLAETASFMGDNTLAKKYLHVIFSILEKLKIKFIFVEMYKNLIDRHMGAILLSENKDKEAELYFVDGLGIDTKAGTKTVGLMWNNIGLGAIYERRKDFIKAGIYYHEAKKIMSTFHLGKNIGSRHIFISILHNTLRKSNYFPQGLLTA